MKTELQKLLKEHKTLKDLKIGESFWLKECSPLLHPELNDKPMKKYIKETEFTAFTIEDGESKVINIESMLNNPVLNKEK